MKNLSPDTVKLLEQVYFSHNGRFRDEHGRCAYRIPNSFTALDLQALADADCQPNNFFKIEHDPAVAMLQDLAKKVNIRQAASAFVASMCSAPLGWRTVLPATALGLKLPAHKADWMGGGSCRICFHSDHGNSNCQDRSLHQYFKATTGSCEDQPLPAILSLQAALALHVDTQQWPEPTARDIWVFHQVLDLLRKLPGKTRYSAARQAIKQANYLQINTLPCCEALLEALATLGILETREYPGLFTRWTDAVVRDKRPRTNVEVPAPLAWWSAADGLNEPLLQELFGHLICPTEEPPAPESTARNPRSKHTRFTQATAKTTPLRNIPGPVAAGDVYAVQMHDGSWGAVYCHEFRAALSGAARGRVEFLSISSPHPPDPAQLSASGWQNRHNGERCQYWCSGLGKTPRVKRVAVGQISPLENNPQPDVISFTNARELAHLAIWHF